MYGLVRPLLFALDPERAHTLSFSSMQFLQRFRLLSLLTQKIPLAPVSVMGINFPNPVGLAAGLDKNGECIDAFAAMGFGFIEVGTVTPRAQPGNPKPRIFRLPQREAIINRLGFNNNGVDALIENLKRTRFKGVLGINVGKNVDTPVEQADDDYLIGMRKVFPYASYITINISSPNTPNLRQLQFGDALKRLLNRVKEEQLILQEKYLRQVPVAIKIAPDLELAEISDLASSFNEYQVDAVIATNTTFSRDGVEGERYADEVGGLSGLPLRKHSTEVITALRSCLNKNIPIIGVGGISDASAAQEKLSAGASLLQIYSGFIYHGPKLVADIVSALPRSSQ